MKNINIKPVLIGIMAALVIGGVSVSFATGVIPAKTMEAAQYAVNAGTVQKPATRAVIAQNDYPSVNPLVIVAYPQKYLNRQVKIKGKFDKFSTLGLDYAPAMRSSEKYISF